PFGVLVLDLDHFKKYNDTWGHLAGNEALQMTASAIKSVIRSVDFPARYGGEEFVVLIPRCNPEGLAHTAERIRTAVESLPPIADRRRLTISIGGALYPHDGRTADELFAAADRRLYGAKEGGRNRAVLPEKISNVLPHDPRRKRR
ncbi:MAG: GGDEF domain-containing protein, partial [Thermoanaerobaculia bacterium]|nr:GGDEF domain-containing protein [Thermoanaerobaculia bacterium]